MVRGGKLAKKAKTACLVSGDSGGCRDDELASSHAELSGKSKELECFIPRRAEECADATGVNAVGEKE